MLEQIGRLGKSLGRPLGRLSLMEHPERKSPLSSGSLVTSGPTHGDLVCSGRQGAHSEPWVAPAESGLGAWPARVGLGRSLEASFGSGGGGALALFWPMRMTDFTVLSCSINQKATSSWWNETWWVGVWCHPATGGWRPGRLWSPLAAGKAILWLSAAEVGARSCTL